MTLEGRLETDVSTDGRGSKAVSFAFTVRNTGGEPVDLQFSDASKAEFVVEDEGREVWRFTEGRMFAQVVDSETLAPGDETTYEGEWDDPKDGEYTVVAELRAQEETCEARTDLVV